VTRDSRADGQQADALMGLVMAFHEMGDDERRLRESALYGNPVICTPRVFAEAEQDDDGELVARLIAMRDAGLIVVADDPQRRRVELSGRPGYQNRAARRAAKRGKPK
jgi:hypothetical protein